MLLDLNDAEQFSPCWTAEVRPKALLLIAYSDPYSILMNCETQAIYCIDAESCHLIAKNFELFFRGLGSIVLKHKSVTEVMQSVGTEYDGFWKEIRSYPDS